MADYITVTKLIVGRATDDDSTTAGSLAAKINDYIETLDSTTGDILQFEVTQMKGHDVLVTIVATDDS